MAPEDVATIIYTSGTTGAPKGVLHTHRATTICVAMLAELWGSLQGFRCISYGPMAHIAERSVSHYANLTMGTVVHSCHDLADLPAVMAEIHPDWWFCAPRMWEKLQTGIEALTADDPARAEAFRSARALGAEVRALRAAGRPVGDALAEDWARARRDVIQPLLAPFGLDKVRIAATGAAPTKRDTHEFFLDCGVPVCENYGQSECPVITSAPADVAVPGTAGKPFPGVELRLAEDGEILARGPHVFAGYLDDPKATAEVLDPDGWIHTGDLGILDEQGNLKVVDRKNEIIICSSGHNMSPVQMEAKLKESPLVAQACVVGHGRPFVVALLVLDPEAAASFARREGLDGLSLPDLARHPAVLTAVDHDVAVANDGFPRAEQVRAFRLLDEEWPVDSELLTPTAKLKRRGLLARFQTVIDELYAGADSHDLQRVGQVLMSLELLGAISIGAAGVGLPEALSHCRVDAHGVPCEWVEATRATQGQPTVVYLLGAEAGACPLDLLSAIRPRSRRRDRCPHPHGGVRLGTGDGILRNGGTRSHGVRLASGRRMRHQGDRFHGRCRRHVRGRRPGSRPRSRAAAPRRRSLAFASLISQRREQGSTSMGGYKYLNVESHDEGRIVRILLNRPQTRNAQNRGLLVELNEAFLAAEADDNVRVVILGAVGPTFSSGHDSGSKEAIAERTGPDPHPTFSINGATRQGAEQIMLQEWHYFFENTRRWRNLRKITIAQVNGTVFSAGLMLMWACDLIVAADDTEFTDVVGTRFGMCGLEYFAHPWEFGPRKTKELMLTGDSLGVEEAYRLGMVSKIFPADRPRRPDARVRPPHRRSADDAGPPHQGVGQPDRRQHGVQQLAAGLLHAPPAEPRPLGLGPRRPHAGRPARRRHRQLEGGAAHRAGRKRQSARLSGSRCQEMAKLG